MTAVQEILKRASHEHLSQGSVDLKASLGSLFNCSESITTMLNDLGSKVAVLKGTFPLPEDFITLVHSAILYVALDTPTFSKMLVNAKKGN